MRSVEMRLYEAKTDFEMAPEGPVTRTAIDELKQRTARAGRTLKVISKELNATQGLRALPVKLLGKLGNVKEADKAVAMWRYGCALAQSLLPSDKLLIFTHHSSHVAALDAAPENNLPVLPLLRVLGHCLDMEQPTGPICALR